MSGQRIVRFAFDVAIDEPYNDLHAVQMATEKLDDEETEDIKASLVAIAVLSPAEAKAAGRGETPGVGR